MAKSSKKTRRIIAIAVLILALGAGGAWYYFKHSKPTIITVQTEKATLRSLTETVVANGRIQPVVQVKISPEVSGEVIELPVHEGQRVNKGDLLMKIKPDAYLANRNSERARFKSATANKDLAMANMRKAEVEFKRNELLFSQGLISESTFFEFRNLFEVGKSTCESAEHQIEVARSSLARAEEELTRTTILSPITGIVTVLNIEAGERVVGTAMMTGTDIMTIADLNEMEARVDIGEMDVILIRVGQKARLEVDAFRDKTFTGRVTEIASSSRMPPSNSMNQQNQEATRFEVRIHFEDKEAFRTGMSVTADIETRYRTNALTVPIQCVTTRVLKKDAHASTNALADASASSQEATNSPAKTKERIKDRDKDKDKSKEKEAKKEKPVEVVFILDGEHVKAVPVKRGISDDDHVEIESGLTDGQEVVSGGYKAISRDLEDGMKIKKGESEPVGGKKAG